MSENSRYYQVSASSVDLPAKDIPTPFNVLFRQYADLSLLRPPIAVIAGKGILTFCPSSCTVRFRLRTRLTLIRLALIRKPWSFGVPVSHRDYRYLCLHLLFQPLQHALRHTFCATGMLPYPPTNVGAIASVICLMPDYHPCPIARLVSCYALFK